MSHNISDTYQQNARLKKELQSLKKEYETVEMSAEQLMQLQKTMKQANRITDGGHPIRRTIVALASTAAALVCAFIILPNISPSIAYAMEQLPILGRFVDVVTFRDYRYESERNNATIQVPGINVDNTIAESAGAGTDPGSKEVTDNLTRTVEEINAEIQRITDELITEFEENLDPENHQDIMVKSETLATTPDYFTLKLICYQGAGSGYQWNYFYTIDLKTGQQLKLKDIFTENADYITPISENIKEQMAAQMAADENLYYWLNDDIEGWNFKAITDTTSFYLNEKDNVVICFNEGDVAPMYMGTVEFEIPAQVLQSIRK